MRNHELTKRERAAIDCLIAGMTMRETALRMGVTPHTLRGYVRNLREKLDAATTAHAAVIVVRGKA